MTGSMGMAMWGLFLSCVGVLGGAVYLTYPDRPSAPKEYPEGLEAELGGSGALRVSKYPQGRAIC